MFFFKKLSRIFFKRNYLSFRCNRFIDLGPRTWFALRAAKIHVYRGTEETGQGKVKTTSPLIHGNENLLHQRRICNPIIPPSRPCLIERINVVECVAVFIENVDNNK